MAEKRYEETHPPLHSACREVTARGRPYVPRFTIVITPFGGTNLLEETLVSVLQHRPAGCDVLVLDRDGYDDPYHISDEVTFLKLPKDTNLTRAIQAALNQCDTEILHVLGRGVHVGEDWAIPALGHFRDSRIACVAPLLMRTEPKDKIVACGISYDRAGVRRLGHRGKKLPNRPLTVAQSLGPCLLAGFYRNGALRQLFDSGMIGPRLPDILLDLEIALWLRKQGCKGVFEPDCVLHSPIDDLLSEESSFHRALGAEQLFWRHRPRGTGLSPVLSHFGELAMDILRTLPRPSVIPVAAGRCAGLLSAMIPRRHDPIRQADPQTSATAMPESGKRGVHRRIDSAEPKQQPALNEQRANSRRVS